MNTVKLTINGKVIIAHSNQTILEVVEEQKLDEIPTLCNAAELKPIGSCFLCVVEVEGRRTLVPSCATRVADGMKVITKNDRIIKSRRTALELLLSNHYADCISPCKIACPAGVDAQGYIALAAMGEYRKAVDLVRETNPLPAICGRICVRKCEVVCRRQDVDEPVGINYIKRYVTDSPSAYDGTPECEQTINKTVGIIGAGPAGLTAAWFLGKKGVKSIIYEAMSKTGGMLRYGIPEYRLPKDVLDQEVEYITRVGAEIKCNVRVGKDIKLDELRKNHDAIFLAPGAFGGKPMRVKGEFDTKGVITGAEFLIDKAENPMPVKGTVVVIGGGNTAMDVARTSWRLGADKVIILYRRTKAEMPADKLEIEDCLKEGIEIMELAAPVGIEKAGDYIEGLKCIRMKLGEQDKSGRRSPVPLEGSEFVLPCDLAVPAIGQDPLLKELLENAKEQPSVSKWNTFEVDTKTMKTNIAGVFAGGDAADDGPTVVIDAIRDGQRAAKAIYAFLTNQELQPEPFYITKEFWAKPGKQELGEIKQSPRHEMPEIAVEERKGSFKEVTTGYDWEDMFHEAFRCLSCGCIAFDYCKLRIYAENYGIDMNHYKGYVRKHKVDERHPYVMYDPNKCVLCQKCIRTCERVLPISALGLVNRGFKTEVRPAMNDELADTSCIACGNCVDACPTGALQAKFPFPGRASLAISEEKSFCGFCSIGCPVSVKHISEHRYFLESSGVPGDYLCQYGRFGSELFVKSKRLKEPQIRIGMKYNTLSYRDAYSHAIKGLTAVKEKFGAEAIAVFIYPELSNEEMYLASRIAREGLGTNNISSIEMLETGVISGVLDDSFGFTASTADRKALREADLIICNNVNLQTEHLILSVEVIDAIKSGKAKLVIADSSKNPLESLATMNLDTMRGRASHLWNAVIKSLIIDGFIADADMQKIPGCKEFQKTLMDYNIKSLITNSGVEQNKVTATSEMIKKAKRIVIIHSPDRSRDLSPGDNEAFANLAILLRTRGIIADLLLPSMTANGSGVEISGADPAFKPGRIPAKGLIGAKNREEFLGLLKAGKIKGALIIGEDPMRFDETASYFSEIEFLVAVDWAVTETTQFADVAIPGSTYLESEGSRCNFEGTVRRFAPAVQSIAGLKTWQILRNIADNLGIEITGVFGQISSALEKLAASNLGEKLAFYMHNGEKPVWDGKGNLVAVDLTGKAGARTPAMTPIANYKRLVHEVGIKNFKVSSRS